MLVLLVAAAGAVSAKRLAVFGDSVSDNGNGKLIFPGPSNATGRYEILMRNNIINECIRSAGTNPLVKATFEGLGFQASAPISLIDCLAKTARCI